MPGGHFWPAPLIQLNPSFKPDRSNDDLADPGTLAVKYARHSKPTNLPRAAILPGMPVRPLENGDLDVKC